MSLFRQLLVTISVVFLLVLAGVQIIYVMNARSYLQQQLDSHSQDAATALGLALATVMPSGDRALMETVMSPVFDRGYYQSITVLSTQGEVLVTKTLEPRPLDVPAWFVQLVVLQAPSNESLISVGWRQLGRVIVTSHPNFAYQQLWRTSLETLGLLLALYVAALWVLRLFLTAILKPLAQIRVTAEAISERNFDTIDTQPQAPELRAVVAAINSMSGKIRRMIESEVLRAEQYRSEAFLDTVSGLENRRGFEQQIGELLGPQSEAYAGLLLLLELNDFKTYNQVHGFMRGDQLIAHTGRSLSEIWPGRLAVKARIGGATFTLALVNVNIDDAHRLVAEVCAHLELALAEQGCTDVHFNCGASHFDDAKPDNPALLASADMALEQARTQRPNAYVLQRMEGDTRLAKGSQYWKREITDALNDNRIALFSQPVLPLDGGAPLHEEIVGRLIDKQGEIISAEVFLPMAVRHGLVLRLDQNVVDRLVSHLSAQTGTLGRYALNVSAHSLQDSGFTQGVAQVLREYSALAPRLIFEITEMGVVQDIDAALRFARLLRAAGAQFAVDNFGLHRDAFRYLQSLMPNYIKPSRSFFEKIDANPQNQFFIASVVKIAQPLDIHVIAQAIEDTSLLPLLKTLGLAGCQGYATGRPTRIA